MTNQHPSIWSDELHTEVCRRREAGETIAAIARAVGLTEAQVSNRLNRFRITKPGEPTWTPERHAELIRRWRDAGESAERIAKAMGLTKNQVIGRLDRNGMIGEGPRCQQPKCPSKGLDERLDAIEAAFQKALDECKLPPERMYDRSGRDLEALELVP
jgi:transposase-like protein